MSRGSMHGDLEIAWSGQSYGGLDSRMWAGQCMEGVVELFLHYPNIYIFIYIAVTLEVFEHCRKAKNEDI